MSREIKFRAYDKKNKKFIHPEAFWIHPFGEVYYLDYNCDQQMSISEDHVILMQFTGLRDKNGKEIYEGDIVKRDIFHDGNLFEIKCENMNGIENLYDYMIPEYFEVVGNIYKNPELLKKLK